MSFTNLSWKKSGGRNRNKNLQNINSNNMNPTNFNTRKIGESNTLIPAFNNFKYDTNSGIFNATTGERNFQNMPIYYPFNNYQNTTTISNESLNPELVNPYLFNLSLQDFPSDGGFVSSGNLPKNTTSPFNQSATLFDTNSKIAITPVNYNTESAFGINNPVESISSALLINTFLYVPSETKNFCLCAIDDISQNNLRSNEQLSFNTTPATGLSGECLYIWYPDFNGDGRVLLISKNNNPNDSTPFSAITYKFTPIFDAWHEFTTCLAGNSIYTSLNGNIVNVNSTALPYTNGTFIPDNPISINLAPYYFDPNNTTPIQNSGNYGPQTGSVKLLEYKIANFAATANNIQSIQQFITKNSFGTGFNLPNKNGYLDYVLNKDITFFTNQILSDGGLNNNGQFNNYGQFQNFSTSIFYDDTYFKGNVTFNGGTDIVFDSSLVKQLTVFSPIASGVTHSFLIENGGWNSSISTFNPTMLVYNRNTNDTTFNTNGLMFSISGENVSIGDIFGSNTLDISGNVEIHNGHLTMEGGEITINNLFTTGGVYIEDLSNPTTLSDSSNSDSSAFSVLGGGGVQKNFFVGGLLNVGGSVGIGKQNTNSDYTLDMCGNLLLTAKGSGASQQPTLTLQYDTSPYTYISSSSITDPTSSFSGQLTFQAGSFSFINSIDAVATQRMTIDTSGNVGIGTDTPNYTLDVSGTGNFTDNLTVTRDVSDTALINVIGPGGQGSYVMYGLDTFSTSNFTPPRSGPAVQIRATDTGSYAANLSFWTAENGDDPLADAVERMTITHSGNVGIGTDTPTYTLDVSGNTNITGSLELSGNKINITNSTPNSSIAIGTNAGLTSQNQFSIAMGKGAGQNNQNEYSIAIGTQAGQTDQSNNSIAMGYQAGYDNQNQYSIAMGYEAGYQNQNEYSIAIGRRAGQTSQSNNSIAMGEQAGRFSQSANSIAMGYQAGYDNQNEYSIAIGRRAGQTSQSNNSIAMGYQAGYDNQNEYSIAMGYQAGFNDQSNNSIAMGTGAGKNNQGTFSIAIGEEAGNLDQGIGTIAIGANAGLTDQSANSIAIGTLAGSNHQSSNSIAIGPSAGSASLGENSIAIGASTVNQFNTSVALGAGATTTANNQIVLGTASETVTIPGGLNVNETDVSGRLYISSYNNSDYGTAYSNLDGSANTFMSFNDLGEQTFSRLRYNIQHLASGVTRGLEYQAGDNWPQDPYSFRITHYASNSGTQAWPFFMIDGTRVNNQINGNLFINTGEFGSDSKLNSTSNGLTIQSIQSDYTTAITNAYIYGNGQAFFSSKVGIGTDTPNYTLDVSGTGNFTDNLTVTRDVSDTALINVIGPGEGGSYVMYGLDTFPTSSYNPPRSGPAVQIRATDTGSYAANLSFWTAENGDPLNDAVERMTITQSGNVGIGTDTPTYTLDVTGTGNFTGSVNGVTSTNTDGTELATLDWVIGHTSTGGGGWTYSSGTPNTLTAKQDTQVVINSISGLTSNVSLSVGGVINSASFNSTSDVRLKENITNLDNSLDKICNIRGVNYNWKNDETKTKTAGVIAQEVLEQIPEAVNDNDSEKLSVNYNSIIAHLIESVKELKREIDELKSK